MIVNLVFEDIFLTPFKHIVVAVNAEGQNYTGFAGKVARQYWPELHETGGKLGTVLQKQVADKTFYAFVCYDLFDYEWLLSPLKFEECLDQLEVPEDERIATILIGGNTVGRLGGPVAMEILGAMARSKNKFVVYMPD